MKTKFLFALFVSMLLFSVSSFASPSNEREKTEVHDVGWFLSTNYNISEITTANVAVLDVNENTPITDLDFIDPGSAVLVNIYQYKKKKFVSFNRTENRRMLQLYGKTDNEYRTILASCKITPLPSSYKIYKEQTKIPMLYTPELE